MSRKVMVTREVAEALTETEHNFISKGATLRVHAVNGFTGKYEVLQTLDIEYLAKALIFGYEVAKTPADNLRDFYNAPERDVCQYEDKTRVVEITLAILGIKIEGVNGDET